MATSLSSAEVEFLGVKPPETAGHEESRSTPPGPATANAPFIGVPLGFILVGLCSMVSVTGLLILKPSILASYHYNQYVVAATHLAVLGWIASVIFGALYQLVPVVLETKLYSERLAWVHLMTHIVGVVGMTWSFWHWNLKHVSHWGSILTVGVFVLLFNIGRTVLRSRKWNHVSAGLITSLSWIGLTVLVGLALAASKGSHGSAESLSQTSVLGVMINGLQSMALYFQRFDQMSIMHAHAHLGVLGCFLILLITISLKLLPMFLLSEIQSTRRIGWVIGLLNVGLVGLVVTVALRSSLKLGFAAVILIALTLYGLELRAILRERKRIKLDWPIKTFLAGLLFVLPLFALAPVLSWPGLPLNVFTGQLENLYGFLALAGLLTTAILGMLFKILPFLVWYGTYSFHIGKSKVPSLAQMYSERQVWMGGSVYGVGMAVMMVGILMTSEIIVRSGAVVLAVAVGMHCLNVGFILSHLVRPRLSPLA